MDENAVLDRVRRSFAKAAPGGLDIVVPLADCEVFLICASSTTLDFVVRPINAPGIGPNPARAVTAAEMLVRSTETLWRGLEKSLACGRMRNKPALLRCLIEDANTASTLLAWETQSPLRTPSAKIAYVFCGAYLLVALMLTGWQMATVHTEEARQANILGIALALVIAAVSTPIPTLMSWRDWKKSLSWKYTRSAP
jgi:hypothetical protein